MTIAGSSAAGLLLSKFHHKHQSMIRASAASADDEVQVTEQSGVYGLGLDRPPLWLYILVQRGELGGRQSSEPLSVFAKGRLEL
jgi:hypothetical protein